MQRKGEKEGDEKASWLLQVSVTAHRVGKGFRKENTASVKGNTLG